LRRCMDMAPFPGLQIDIFVTNAPIHPRRQPTASRPQSTQSIPEELLSPMSPGGAPAIEVLSPTDPAYRQSSHIGNNGHLAPPQPRFARPRSQSGASAVSGDSDYSTFDLGYYRTAPEPEEQDIVDDIVDLTNWDGDNDVVLPGEKRLSRQVQSAGRHMRAMSRRMSQFNPNFKLGGGGEAGVGPDEKGRWSHLSSTDRLLSSGLGVPDGPGGSGARGRPALVHGHSPLALSGAQASSSTSPPRSPTPQGHRPSPLAQGAAARQSWVSFAPDSRAMSPPGSPARHAHRRSGQIVPSPITEGDEEDLSDVGSYDDHSDSATVVSRPGSAMSATGWDSRSDAHSVSDLVGSRPGRGGGHARSRSEQVRLEVESQEMQDISAVAEFARPGRPRLQRFLAEEVDRSHGAVIVGCTWFFFFFCVCYTCAC
jgi:hypothetical protein